MLSLPLSLPFPRLLSFSVPGRFRRPSHGTRPKSKLGTVNSPSRQGTAPCGLVPFQPSRSPCHPMFKYPSVRGLPARCRGRGKRRAPSFRPFGAHLSKPSREGEESLASDFVGVTLSVPLKPTLTESSYGVRSLALLGSRMDFRDGGPLALSNLRRAQLLCHSASLMQARLATSGDSKPGTSSKGATP